jgi:hypothetical protein
MEETDSYKDPIFILWETKQKIRENWNERLTVRKVSENFEGINSLHLFQRKREKVRERVWNFNDSFAFLSFNGD